MKIKMLTSVVISEILFYQIYDVLEVGVDIDKELAEEFLSLNRAVLTEENVKEEKRKTRKTSKKVIEDEN